MLVRFSHVMIYSPKHADTVQWYCDKLGFEIDYNAPGEYASLHHRREGESPWFADFVDNVGNCWGIEEV